MKTLMTIIMLTWLAAVVQASEPSIISLYTSDIAALSGGEGAIATTPYVAQFTLPEGIEGVRQAWLELWVDASARETGGFIDPAPLFEVYMLTGEVAGSVDARMFAEMHAPMSRPVAVGENRRVRIDITEFVQKILADPTSNHGLVFGAVTADTRGLFTLKTDSFGPGTVARVTIVE